MCNFLVACKIMKRFLFVFSFVAFFICALSSCSSNKYFSRAFGGEKIDGLAEEYIKLADGYVELKKYDNAISYYEQALKSKTHYYDALFKIARTSALKKDWVRAKKSYEELLERDPENMSLQSSLAYVSAMSGDLENALKSYEMLYEKYPDGQGILENYIAVLLVAEHKDLAREKIVMLEEKFPNSEKLSAFKKSIKLEEADESENE